MDQRTEVGREMDTDQRQGGKDEPCIVKCHGRLPCDAEQ